MKRLLLLYAIVFTFASYGQNLIQGTVSDSNDALTFANVLIKHSTKGVFTNEKGCFNIEAKPSDTLQISYLGYETKEIVIGQQKQIDVLLEGFEKLDEVILYSPSRHVTRCGMRCCYEVIYLDDDFKNSNEVKLYPNPSQDGIFYMALKDDFTEVSVVVANLTGRIIVNKTIKTFDSSITIGLSDQPSGIYIVNVSSNGMKIASKKAIRL